MQDEGLKAETNPLRYGGTQLEIEISSIIRVGGLRLCTASKTAYPRAKLGLIRSQLKISTFI